ncbi:hypothetical protein D3C77_121820 [compost metagenome]
MTTKFFPPIDLTTASTLALAAGHAARDSAATAGAASVKLEALSVRLSELALQVLDGKQLPRQTDDEATSA